MPKYRYEAISIDGNRIYGVIEAEGQREVLETLYTQKYYTSSVKEINNDNKVKLVKKVNSKELSMFAKQFYAMLHVGISAVVALELISEQTKNARLKNAIISICEKLKRGNSLTNAFYSEKDVFPSMISYMIAAGEETGELDIIIEKIAVYYEKNYKLKNKLQAAMIYPIIVLIVNIIVMFFVTSTVLPTYAAMFARNDAKLPWLTQKILLFSDFIQVHGLLILLIGCCLLLIGKFFLSTSNGRIMKDKIILKLPIVGGLQKKIILSNFTRLLAMLLLSGVEMIKALDIVKNAINNSIFSKVIDDIKEDVIEGKSLAEAANGKVIFTKVLINMIVIGENTGSMDKMLTSMADFYSEEVDVTIQKSMAYLEPAMIMIMALIVGVLAISVMLPMFDITNTIPM